MTPKEIFVSRIHELALRTTYDHLRKDLRKLQISPRLITRGSKDNPQIAGVRLRPRHYARRRNVEEDDGSVRVRLDLSYEEDFQVRDNNGRMREVSGVRIVHPGALEEGPVTHRDVTASSKLLERSMEFLKDEFPSLRRNETIYVAERPKKVTTWTYYVPPTYYDGE